MISNLTVMSLFALSVVIAPPIVKVPAAAPMVKVGMAPVVFMAFIMPVPAVVKLVVCAGTIKVPIAGDAGAVSLTLRVHVVKLASIVAVVMKPVPAAAIVIAFNATELISASVMVLVSAILSVVGPVLMSNFVVMSAFALKVVTLPPNVTAGTVPVKFSVVTVPVPAVVKLVVWAGTFKVPIAAEAVTVSLTVNVHALRSASIVAVVITAVLTAEIVMALAFTAPISINAMIRPVATISVDTLELMSNLAFIAKFALSVVTAPPMVNVLIALPMVSVGMAPVVFMAVKTPVPAVVKLVV